MRHVLLRLLVTSRVMSHGARSPRLSARRLLLAGALVVGSVLILSACKTQDNTKPAVEHQDRIIATASSTDDPARIAITWFPAPCEAFDGVLVELDDRYATLTVTVTVDVVNCPEAAVSEAIVDLGEPLGGREIWDSAFANTVALDT